MRASLVALLPLDVRLNIRDIVVQEKHVLMRLLLKKTIREMRSSQQSLLLAKRLWESIYELGCFDHALCCESKLQNDLWLMNLSNDDRLLRIYTWCVSPYLWRMMLISDPRLEPRSS